MKRKEEDEIQVEEIRFNDIRKKGLMGNIDKKRTLLEAHETQCHWRENEKKARISVDDLRFKTWEENVSPIPMRLLLP